MNIDKELNSLRKFGKEERSSFPYWFNHWTAYNLVAIKCGKWRLKYLFHDWYKPWLKLFMPYEDVQKFHREHSNHHLEWMNKKIGDIENYDDFKWFSTIYHILHDYDYDGTIIDWECSRYTKDASPLTAYEEYEKLFDFNGEKFLEKYPNVKSYYAYVSKRFRESLKKLKLID